MPKFIEFSIIENSDNLTAAAVLVDSIISVEQYRHEDTLRCLIETTDVWYRTEDPFDAIMRRLRA